MRRICYVSSMMLMSSILRVGKLSVIPSGMPQCRYSIGELHKKLLEDEYSGDIVEVYTGAFR